MEMECCVIKSAANEKISTSTRHRIVALQERLVRIQSQCIVTSDSLDFHGRRCSVLEETIRTVGAFKEDRGFIGWRSLVTRLWHCLRRKVGWPETRGFKYLSREMGDLDARLKRQCACVEWGMSEEAFVCACALAEEENDEWRRLSVCGGGGDCSAIPYVPDFGCRTVEETMKFALERCWYCGDPDIVLHEPLNEENVEEITAEPSNETMICFEPLSKSPKMSRIPKFISTTLRNTELSNKGSCRRGSRIPIATTIPIAATIPIATTMRRKRASIAAIPLTPPRAHDTRYDSLAKRNVLGRSTSNIPRPSSEKKPRKLSFS